MPKLIGEYMYFDVKLGDSEVFQIPKMTCHKEQFMIDHGICKKLASQLESNQKEINISLDDIPNEKLFEKILDFSFTKSNQITIARCEYKDLNKMCTYFNLDEFKEFVKGEFRRKDLSFRRAYNMQHIDRWRSQ